MRRAFTIPVALGCVIAIVVVLAAGGSSGYRVDAVFDTAKGMVPGQLVEIAGARVGTITGVKLIRSGSGRSGYGALIEMNIDRRFAPFYADAACQILPQGPISENFVECGRGTPTSGALAVGPRGAPTVPVGHNSEALDVQDVLNVFSMPTDQRLGILIDELGIATAGRGADLRAIIERANPALVQAQRVLSVLGAQRSQIGAAVVQTDRILGSLARTSTGVREFVDRAASVTRTTATHRSALGASIARLPAMLSQLDGGLKSIDTVTRAGTPLLHELRASAPGLLTLTHTLADFSTLGTPALQALGPVSLHGQVAITVARPLVQQLRRFGTTEGTNAYLLDHLLTSLRDSGGIEGALLVLYGITADDAGYDSTSHFLSLLADVYPTCIADNTLPGCQHSYNSPGQGTLPVNDPGAGPQSSWSPIPGQPEQTGSSLPSGTTTGSKVPPAISPARMRALLNYLLG